MTAEQWVEVIAVLVLVPVLVEVWPEVGGPLLLLLVLALLARDVQQSGGL